jgi:hypothetical protein
MNNSTGPRTPRGKARSSQNAAKHWMNSGRILSSERKEALFLRQGYQDDFKAEGLAENEIVDDMVLNRLIRRRIDAAFTRESWKAGVGRVFSWWNDTEPSAIDYFLRSPRRLAKYPIDQGARLRPDLCIPLLEWMRDQIGESGPQPARDYVALCRIYGGFPTVLGAALIDGLEEIVAKGPAKITDQEEVKKWLTETMEKEIEAQKRQLDASMCFKAIEFAGLKEPATPVLENLLRYRAANTREFENLLDSFERIRRLRRNAAKAAQSPKLTCCGDGSPAGSFVK